MRNKGLDLLKWFAIIMMVIDHLRLIHYFSGYNNILVTIGRFAFPTFCFILAVNFLRIHQSNNFTALKSYLFNLVIFSLISELPYRLLEHEPTTVNVMPTLLLSMIFMILVESKYKHKLGLIIFFILFLININQWLMYGILGVLLPSTCLLALKFPHKKMIILLPMAIAALCNVQYLIAAIHTLPYLVFSIGSCASLGILFCFYLMNKHLSTWSWSVIPVGRWAYWFYPVHLFMFSLLNLFTYHVLNSSIT